MASLFFRLVSTSGSLEVLTIQILQERDCAESDIEYHKRVADPRQLEFEKETGQHQAGNECVQGVGDRPFHRIRSSILTDRDLSWLGWHVMQYSHLC